MGVDLIDYGEIDGWDHGSLLAAEIGTFSAAVIKRRRINGLDGGVDRKDQKGMAENGGKWKTAVWIADIDVGGQNQ